MVAIIRRETYNFQSKVARIDELIEIHEYGMVGANNSIIIDVKELDKVTEAMKSYRAK